MGSIFALQVANSGFIKTRTKLQCHCRRISARILRISRNKKLATSYKIVYDNGDASVAQWIEQWPPEPRAEVRFLSDAFFI